MKINDILQEQSKRPTFAELLQATGYEGVPGGDWPAMYHEAERTQKFIELVKQHYDPLDTGMDTDHSYNPRDNEKVLLYPLDGPEGYAIKVTPYNRDTGYPSWALTKPVSQIKF